MADPDFWLKVARAMGKDVREHVDGLFEFYSDYEAVPWHPPTNPAQAWEMEEWAFAQGCDIHAWHSNKGDVAVDLIETNGLECHGRGPDRVTALGAAILEVVG